MPAPQPLRLPFPRGGVVKRFGHADQPPLTTYSAMNVWPAQPSTGRLRGGTRPSLVSLGDSGGTPYHWCDVAWKSTGGGHSTFVNRATAVLSSTGVKTSPTGVTWTSQIGTAPSSDFCSIAMFQQTLFMASIGLTDVLYKNLAAGTSGDLTSDASAGTAPTNAGVVCVHGGRILIGGIKDEPHVVRGCRVGDYYDWDDTSTDSDAAFSTTGSGNTQIGEPVVVIFSHNRDCAFVGGPNSCYMIQGNIAANGTIYRLSSGLGPLQMSAVCKADDDTYFHTRVGPHIIRSGCGHAPIPVAADQIPEDLIGLDPANGDYASCAFDERWRMVHFYAKRYSGGQEIYWGYQIDTKSWWPMEFESTISMVAQLPGIVSDDVASCLPIGSGGTAHKFDRSSTSESMDSHVDFGPIPLSQSPGEVGILTCLNADLAEDSDAADYAIYAGDSEQEAMTTTTQATTGGTWDRQGRNVERRPRVRGKAARVRVSGNSGRFSIESLLPTVAVVGGRRTE